MKTISLLPHFRTCRIGSCLLPLALLVLAAGCTPLKQYRTDYRENAPALCESNTVEVTTNYLLGVVEFDDQGWLWDRRQMNTVVDRFMAEDNASGLLLVVFVHGWKHNASYQDDNVQMFRTNLGELAEMERQFAHQSGQKPRQVAGVYVGWRGLSNKAWLLRQLTFWDRKNTAQEVGRGGVTELYSRLEELRSSSRLIHGDEARRRQTQLIIVGHSFGGALTYAALAPVLIERAVQTAPGARSMGAVRGFGDLVVLINPAFEAARFKALFGVTTNQTWYPTNQSVNLAIFTSKGDGATKTAFPMGRWISTMWENDRDKAQGRANRTAVGHYAPFLTHDLMPWTNAVKSVPKSPTPASAKKATVRSKNYTGQQTIPESVIQVKDLMRQIREHSEKDAREMPDRSYEFSNAKLIPRGKPTPHLPVINVSVAKQIIPNHGDIDTQAFMTFLREFVSAFTADESNPRR